MISQKYLFVNGVEEINYAVFYVLPLGEGACLPFLLLHYRKREVVCIVDYLARRQGERRGVIGEFIRRGGGYSPVFLYYRVIKFNDSEKHVKEKEYALKKLLTFNGNYVIL